MTNSWPVRHFSQSNPAGDGQANVPALLRRVAASIEQYDDVEIQDVVFHHELDEDGSSWPTMTVYFRASADG